jgi:hypothetical protein
MTEYYRLRKEEGYHLSYYGVQRFLEIFLRHPLLACTKVII